MTTDTKAAAPTVDKSTDRKRKKATDLQASAATTKTDRLIAALSRAEGATLAELAATTDWQTHSVRGAISGVLKKKGLAVVSEKVDGVRRYRIAS